MSSPMSMASPSVPATQERRFERVAFQASGPVGELMLAQPPLNLVTRQMLEELHEVLGMVSKRQDIRCLIVHQGSARAFCAGSDMREFGAIADRAVQQKILFEEYVTRQLATLHCPTVAAIDGAALGGGFELALACDLRVASPLSRVGLTESLIGGLGGSGAVRVARLIGPARSAEMLFTGKVLDAAQACSWGLINEVVQGRPVLERAREWASLIASRGPLSNAFAKRLIAASLDGASAQALALANELQERIFQSEDLQRGAQAFFEKTPVSFVGS